MKKNLIFISCLIGILFLMGCGFYSSGNWQSQNSTQNNSENSCLSDSDCVLYNYSKCCSLCAKFVINRETYLARERWRAENCNESKCVLFNEYECNPTYYVTVKCVNGTCLGKQFGENENLIAPKNNIVKENLSRTLTNNSLIVFRRIFPLNISDKKTCDFSFDKEVCICPEGYMKDNEDSICLPKECELMEGNELYGDVGLPKKIACRMAFFEQDPTYCDVYRNKADKDLCIIAFVEKTINITLCESLSTLELRENCLRFVKNERII